MAKAVKKPAAEKTVKDETRQASEADSPTEAAKTTQPVAEAPEKEVKTPVEEGERADLKDKPKDAKAFQEQRQEIKRLKEELAKKERSRAAFETLRPQTQRVPLQMPKVEQFMDADGKIRISEYENARDQYQQTQTYRAESSRSQDKFEMEQSLTKIQNPEIDPESEKYDKELEARVADRYGRLLLESITHGKPEPSLLSVTAEIKKQYKPKESKVSQEAQKNASVKDQAASVSTAPSSGRARGYESESDLETLRHQSRMGGEKGMDALASRISKIPDK